MLLENDRALYLIYLVATAAIASRGPIVSDEFQNTNISSTQSSQMINHIAGNGDQTCLNFTDQTTIVVVG